MTHAFFPEPIHERGSQARVSRYAFASDFNPWLRALAPIAAAMQRDRHSIPEANSFKIHKNRTFDAITELITQASELRDQSYESWFEALYGRPIAAEPAVVNPPSSTISEPACGRLR